MRGDEQNVGNVLSATLNETLTTVVEFLPRFLSGLIVLLVGIIIAAFLKQIVEQVLRFLHIESFLRRYGVPETKGVASWSAIISEIVRWFVIILFLVPVAGVWGLGDFVRVLNGLLLYLPNVFVSVLLLLVGLVVARLARDLLRASISGLSHQAARTIANAAYWAVVGFVVLVVLNQLGIASDLIRILFAGIVAMVSLAGGLAFGLGGKDSARTLIDQMVKRMELEEKVTKK